MDLDDFRSQILNGILTSNDDSIRKQKEEMFFALLEDNPCLTLQLLIVNSNSNDPSNAASIILLGRTASLIADKLVEIGDEQFHQDFQSSLLSLLQNSTLSSNLLSNISFIISIYSKIYAPNWPSLLEGLFQIIQNSEDPSFAIDCLTYCISNNSIICNEQILEVIIQLTQGIFENIEVLIPQFLSAVKLIFVLYRCESIDEAFKSNLKVYSDKIIGVNCENSESSLHNNFMIELSNFTDENIDFFESSLGNFIDLLGTILCSQQNIDIVENQSILILKDIFSNKKYVKEFGPKSIEVYDLLVKIISSKLPETEIDSNEGENDLNESNTISNAKDALKSIAHNYGGLDEVSIYMISSFGDQQPEELFIFISNFISFGCVIDEIIDFIDPITFLSYIIPIYKIGISNQSVDCRYRSIVSLKKVIKALDNYQGGFDWDSQEIITLIFEALSKESVPIIITSLLLALKASLFTFNDYHDNIENIISPLDSNFDSFSNKQQSIIISCYSYCCQLCEDENDPYQELMCGIFNKIISYLRDGFQSLADDFYFSCLDSVLDFDRFAPPDSFDEISSIIIKFISMFDSMPNEDGTESTMMDVLDYKKIDIINRTLRGLISICPKEHILEFSSQVFQPLFAMSLSDIIPIKCSLDESKSEYQTNYEVIRSTEENSWICYSKNSISNVSEALLSIYSFLSKCPEIADHFMEQITSIIEKWLTGCFSFTLVEKCARILIILLNNNEKMKLQEMEGFVLSSFIKIMTAFDLIGDEINDKIEDSSEQTIKLIRLFIKIFDFIGENFNSPNSLSVVVESNPNPINLIFKLYSKWMKLHQVDISFSDDKNIDGFANEIVKVEVEIGKMFDPIFKYFSTAEVGERIIPLLLEYFPIDSPSDFITPTFFESYSSFIVYSSLCNEEHIMKICQLFTEILTGTLNGFPSYVPENAAKSIVKIMNSGKLAVDTLTILIDKLNEAIQIDKEKIDRPIILQLLILIENAYKNEINLELEESNKNIFVDQLIQLLLVCLPISYLDNDDQKIQSAESFLFLISLNHPMMSDPHNLAMLCSLALVFIIIVKPPKQIMKQLRAFVKSVFQDEQGQVVYNELLSLPLTERFGKECLERIEKLMGSQNNQ